MPEMLNLTPRYTAVRLPRFFAALTSALTSWNFSQPTNLSMYRDVSKSTTPFSVPTKDLKATRLLWKARETPAKMVRMSQKVMRQ